MCLPNLHKGRVSWYNSSVCSVGCTGTEGIFGGGTELTAGSGSGIPGILNSCRSCRSMGASVEFVRYQITEVSSTDIEAVPDHT